MKILERHHHSVCGQKSSVCSNRGHTSTPPHSPRRRLRQVLPILSEIKTYWEDLETEESSDVRPPWTHTLGLQKTCTDMQDSKTNSHFFLLSLRNLQAMSIATGQIHSFSSYHIHFRFAVVLRMWSAIHASERRSGTVSKVGSVRLSQLQLRWRARHATYFDGDITSRPLDRRILCVDNISQWPSPTVIHHREGPRRFQIYMYVVKHVETKMIAKAGSSVQLTSFHRRLTTNLNLHQET